MTIPVSEAKTEALMAEAEQLHDIIYNIECYTTEDRLRLESLYAELGRRVISVVEGYSVKFVEHLQSRN